MLQLMRFLLHHTLIDMHAADFMEIYLDPHLHFSLRAQLIPLEVICNQELLPSS